MTPTPPPIRTHPRLQCPICGSDGKVLYRGLKDRLWEAAPGEWTMRSCGRCGCLWIDQVPEPSEIGRLYARYYTHEVASEQDGVLSWIFRAWNSVTDGYLRSRLGYREGVGARWLAWVGWLSYLHPGAPDEVAHRVMHLRAPIPGARVLDVGCGNGDLMHRLRRRGWEVVGIDLDEDAVCTARSRGLDARVGDLETQRFPAQSFDAISVSHVIEHVIKPAALMKECARILKPGGRLVVLTPNPRSQGHSKYGDSWVGLDPPRHLVLLTRDNLRSLAESAGLRVLLLRSGQRAVREQWWLSRRIKHLDKADVHALRMRWQLRGVPAQYLQRFLLPFQPDIGEELILIATRD